MQIPAARSPSSPPMQPAAARPAPLPAAALPPARTRPRASTDRPARAQNPNRAAHAARPPRTATQTCTGLCTVVVPALRGCIGPLGRAAALATPQHRASVRWSQRTHVRGFSSHHVINLRDFGDFRRFPRFRDFRRFPRFPRFPEISEILRFPRFLRDTAENSVPVPLLQRFFIRHLTPVPRSRTHYFHCEEE